MSLRSVCLRRGRPPAWTPTGCPPAWPRGPPVDAHPLGCSPASPMPQQSIPRAALHHVLRRHRLYRLYPSAMSTTPVGIYKRRSSRLLAKTMSSPPPVEQHTALVDRVLVARASCLANPALGAATVYTGPPQTILNGMSSMRTSSGTTLQLTSGTHVRVCSRPTIPFGTTESSVRMHFSIHANGHASDCVCGACGFAYDFANSAPDLCSCGTEVYDEGEQQCTIM